MANLIGRIKAVEKITKPINTDLRDAVIEVYKKEGTDYYTSKIDGLEHKVSDIKDSKTGLIALAYTFIGGGDTPITNL